MRQVQVGPSGLVAVMAGDVVLAVLDAADLGIERAYDAEMPRRSDPRRVAIAQITGTAFAYAAGRRARVDALAEIAEVTRDPDVLTDAAATYVDTDPADPYARWHALAVELLAEAGADLDEARRRRAANPRRPGLT